MRINQRIIAGTLALMVVLFGIAVENEVTHRYQILPFSSWSLFSRVPDRERVDHGIRITSLNGVVQDPPVYFESAGLIGSSSPPAYELIQDMGSHFRRGEYLKADAVWRTFAGRYMTDVTRAEVEVVRRRYDVLERRRCECFETEEVIAVLEKGP